MRVLLANPRGFCAGVAMAVEVVDRLTNVLDEPIYVYHDIVHNRHVVNRFEAKGVVFPRPSRPFPRDRYWCSVLMESVRKCGAKPKHATCVLSMPRAR